MPASFYWDDLSTAEFAARDFSKTVAVLPVGATEQHGPHLPVSVDATINQAIVRHAVALLPPDADVLFLPALRVGKSDEHLAYPGTLAVSGETLRRVWLDIARSVARTGARRLIFFNSHGGQMALMEIACRDIRIELGMLVVGCSWFRVTPLEDLFSAHEIAHGIHGGEIETSVMLAARPAFVAMDKAEDFVPLTVAIEKSGSPLTAEGRTGFGWQAQDLHPAGVAGNARAATRERGETVIARAAGALLTLIEAARAFDLANFSGRTAFQRPEV